MWRFYADPAELLSSQWKMAIVINPNNPTGEMTEPDCLMAILDKANAMGAYLLVDEAFIDATPEKSLLTQLQAETMRQHVFVLRSVGKFFGLAGARVGFMFAHAVWQQRIHNLIGPWPVSTASLYLVGQALLDKPWQQAARRSMAERQRLFLQRVGPKLNTIFDSHERAENPYFVTWQLADQQTAKQAFDWLHQVGVHVRLGESWIRVAIPALNEIAILDQSLVRLLKGVGGRELA